MNKFFGVVFLSVSSYVAVVGMDSQSVVSCYVEKIKSWGVQDVVTLSARDRQAEYTLMYCVPKNREQVPIIGYVHCTCDRVQGLSLDESHKTAVFALFRAAVARLADNGFATVKFTARLLEYPECIASCIGNKNLVPIDDAESPEITISTQLPPVSS